MRTSSLSSFRRARKVALELKDWLEQGKMQLALPTRPIDPTKQACPMHQTAKGPRVLDIMDRKVVSIGEDEEIRAAAQKLLKGETNHLPVVNGTGVTCRDRYDIRCFKSGRKPGEGTHRQGYHEEESDHDNAG